jgi:hypothetical protein
MYRLFNIRYGDEYLLKVYVSEDGESRPIKYVKIIIINILKSVQTK